MGCSNFLLVNLCLLQCLVIDASTSTPGYKCLENVHTKKLLITSFSIIHWYLIDTFMKLSALCYYLQITNFSWFLLTFIYISCQRLQNYQFFIEGFVNFLPFKLLIDVCSTFFYFINFVYRFRFVFLTYTINSSTFIWLFRFLFRVTNRFFSH